MMFSLLPDEWQYTAPESVIVGVGPYTAALASILGTSAIPFAQLHGGSPPNIGGGYDRVLNNARQALLVIPEDMMPADALRCHKSLWNWIEKLTSRKQVHDLRFLFILPESATVGYAEALAVGICVPVIDPVNTGHGVWRRSGELTELVTLLAAIQPMDLLHLEGRRAKESKRMILARLLATAAGDDPEAIRAAVRAVSDSFREKEYLLDTFCRPPSHSNGNLLRRWLNEGVTSPVTQNWYADGRDQLAAWLNDLDE